MDININNIKVSIVNLFQNVKTIIRETLTLPKAKLYIFSSVILTVVFIFLTFPYEVIILSRVQNIEKALGATVNLSELRFSIIGDSKIENAALYFPDGTEYAFKDIVLDLSTNPYRLFVKNNYRGALTVDSLKYSRDKMAIAAKLKCEFDILSQKDNEGNVFDGSFSSMIQNVSVRGVTIKDFDIPAINFPSIELKTTIVNNNIKIEKCVFSGMDLRGKISGTVTIGKIAKFTRLNLRIEIDPTSKILENYKILLGEFGDGMINIGITGTVSNPSINLPKPRSTSPPSKHPEQDTDEKE